MLIRSKLLPPSQAPSAVERVLLVRSICVDRDPRIVMVNAAAGYGKTTLLAQCYAAWRASGTLVAWYSADDDGLDGEEFFSYVMAALAAAGIALPYSQEAIDNGLPGLRWEAAARAVVLALETSEEPVRIIIDDYHRVASQSTRGFITYLVDRMPAHAMILLSARGGGGLPTASLRAAGRIREISHLELRFSDSEAAQLFEVAHDDPGLALLLARTEGWPVALQLFRYRLADRQIRPADVEGLARGLTDLSAYLAEQVFSELEAPIQEFLARTCITTRINASLADALIEGTGSAAILDQLNANNPLVSAIGVSGRWFRYHPLLADFLRHRLAVMRPHLLNPLHRRAARWFVAYGNLPEALHHASSVGDTEFAAQILEAAGGWRVVLSSGGGVLRQLSSIVLDDPSQFPRLALAQAYVAAQTGRVREARTAIDRLKRRMTADTDPQIRFEMLSMEIIVRIYEDRAIDPVDLATIEIALETESDLADDLVALLAHLRCLAYYQGGAYGRTRALGEEALDHARVSRMAHAEAYLHQYLGLAQLQQGRRREAELAFRRGLEHTSRNFGEGSPQYALTAVLLARTLYLTGAFDVADALLSGPLEMIIAGDSWFDVLAAGIISKCWILARTGHRDEAFVTAASGIRLAAMRGLPRLDRFCRLQVVRLNLYFGRVKEAVTEFLSLEGDPFDTTLPNRSFDLEMQLTRAALNLVEGSVPSQIIFEIESIEWDREPNPIRIEARLLLAAAYALANEQDAALQLLRESLDLIAREELRALVFQWGEVLAPLFAAAARDFDRFTLEQRKLLGNSIPQVGSTRGTSAACDEGPLTAREIHVVRGLADGLSSKEIARALGIAESTVKTHRLSIYRKLNVHSRSRVIVAARQLGLLRSTSAETGDPA